MSDVARGVTGVRDGGRHRRVSGWTDVGGGRQTDPYDLPGGTLSEGPGRGTESTGPTLPELRVSPLSLWSTTKRSEGTGDSPRLGKDSVTYVNDKG